MRLLVLGGTKFVGRAVVEAALADGAEVTLLNRGLTGRAPEGARLVVGDRLAQDGLSGLAGAEFDACVDTWVGAPKVVAASAERLSAVCGRYVYVSTRSVYDPLTPGADEDAPVVQASPDADSTSYPQDKRGGELAAVRAFGAGRSSALRCGAIVGPGEDVGRLPWWLTRAADGGDLLCPGPVDLPLQYVDVRDLARFALRCATDGESVYNATSRRGHATMGSLVAACVEATGGTARPVWGSPEFLLAHDVQPWTDLPLWIPPGHEAQGMHDGDSSRAARDGLACRPITETVHDTWSWMQREGWSGPPPDRPLGLDPARAALLLKELDAL